MKPTDAERDPAFDRLIARGLAKEADASGVACPDADLLAAWFDHSLSPNEADRIEAHISSCATCQQILGDLARSEPEVTRAAPVPAQGRPWHWHWRWLVPLATATLVVVVAERTLRAPGETPAATGGQPGLQQPAAVTAEVRDKAAADAVAAPAAPPSVASVPAAPAPVPPAPVRAAPAAPPPAPSQNRPAAAQDRMAEALPPPAAAPSKPAEAKAEGGVVGGAVGGALGGVVKGRADAVAENVTVTAAAPVAAPSAAPQMSVARTSALQMAGAPLHSTSALGPSGATVTWRYGQGGVIERSTDRGETWARQQSGVTTALVDASAPTDRACWIVGDRGVVLRTTDGRTWHRVSSPSLADLVSVHAWSESSATVTASDRSQYETTDGGRSWRLRAPERPLLP